MKHVIKVKATKKGTAVDFKPNSGLWRVSENHASGHFVFSKDEHLMRRSDPHNISFELDDQTGLGLQFPSNARDAMWVVHGQCCPELDDEHCFDVLEPIEVVTDLRTGLRDKLKVRNLNNEIEDWSFSLNFVKRGNHESDKANYVRWDPVVTNQNGGRGLL